MTNYRLRKARCEHCGAVIGRTEGPLTRRQAEIYRYVSEFDRRHGFAPTFEEIAARFRYNSLATVHEHLDNIETKGWIKRRFAEKRSIECLINLDDR